MANASCGNEIAPFWLAGGSLAAGQICLDRGVCVSDLCVCDSMWTGNADYFPLNSCQNPVILDKLLWALCAVSHLRLLIKARDGYARQWNIQNEARREKAKHGTWLKKHTQSWRIFVAFSLLMMLVLPGLVGIFIARAATDLHFGVDLSITLPFSLVYSVYMSCLAVIEHQLFKIMVLGAAASGERNRALDLIRIDRLAKIIGTAMYNILYGGSMIVAVFMPIDPVPARIILVLISNLSTVLYFAHYYFTHNIMVHRLELLLGSDQSKRSVEPGKVAAEEDRGFSHVLGTMKHDMERTRNLVVFLFVLNLIFSVVPQLYAFTYCKNAFMLIVSSGNSHLLLTMSVTAEKSSSSNNTNALSPPPQPRSKNGNTGGTVNNTADEAAVANTVLSSTSNAQPTTVAATAAPLV